ncbi:MAG: ribonuclease H-like domain-containing protein [Candidatus Magnetoovum sp. WYHC-5]|nr:ribonuclease H-like domain-containing protein [Candidatus Magnetoovum sp. WYHC-5]
MIKHSFAIINGIGERTEKRLWRYGICTWNDFINCNFIPFITKERKKYIDETLYRLSNSLDNGGWDLYPDIFNRNEHWRFFKRYREQAICMDIETNGYAFDFGGYCTMVGLYNGKEYQCLIRGRDLTVENLSKALAPYKILITFYGAVFDVPFLLKEFPSLPFNMFHYDICLASRRLGLRGGLKKVEKYLGIKREDLVDGMDGQDAVRLWNDYMMGYDASLETLIRYNREDTVNLLAIGEYVYNELKKATGIEDYMKGVGV